MHQASGLAIPLQNVDAIVALHNIAGKNGVLNNADSPITQYVGNHYAARGIDHIPYSGETPLNAYVLTNQPDMMQSHAAYRGKLANMHFTPITSLQELVQRGVKRAVHLPYIRLADEPFPDEIEWQRYGLPPQATLHMKDKVYIHRWLAEHGYAQFIPNFVGCGVGEITREASRMLGKISAMYAELGMLGRYPLGLIIRGAFSDGNYSMSAIVEAITDMRIRSVSIKRGQVMIKPNGNSANLVVVDNFEEAFARVRDTFYNELNLDSGSQVIMSRLLDIDLSPGLCAPITEGVPRFLQFNGQYMAPDSTACTGTTTFSSAIGSERAEVTSSRYLHQTHNLLAGILESFVPAAENAALYAMMNIDVMMVGDLEKELHARAQQRPNCRYLGNLGTCDADYEPRIYDPNNILFAEINPRDTNWTLAMKAVLQVLHRPCTVENLESLAEGNDVQILARDHWELPEGMSIPEARDLLTEYHYQLAGNGEGIIMRMADNPAGIIIYTTSPDRARLEQISNEAHNFLANRAAPIPA